MKALFAALLIGFFSSAAPADSTISPTDNFSFATNAGWINARWNGSPAEGIVVTESLLSGSCYSANMGWIHLGDGDPTNDHTYSQSGQDFGVNHDGEGKLTGLAYGSNIGWINFDWAVGDDPNEPRLDLATGEFSGYAYGANVGWIRFDAAASVILRTDSIEIPDTDSDQIADWWEYQNAGNLTTFTATSDKDKDGSSDRDEYEALTDPDDPTSWLIATPSYSSGSTTFTITFPSDPGRRYRIETSTKLSGWSDSGLGTFSPDAGSTTTKDLTILGSTAEDTRFFRVVAVVPLQ